MGYPKRVTRNGEVKKPTRYYSKKQEEAVAKEFNGKRQKNSGATMFQKSDVMLDNIAVECKTKTTKSNSISIKEEWLIKLSEEALFMGKPYSALFFNFGPDEPNYVILDEKFFKELVKE